MGDPVGSLFMLTRVFILFGTLALVNFVLIVLFIPDQQIFSVETYTNDGSTKEQIISLMWKHVAIKQERRTWKTGD